ncbi:MAG: segregation/condensation protein A [Deltaproteobacteria bacterium]|nr:segregation/condensation protein A [Deltaproteobacteria bacterium]
MSEAPSESLPADAEDAPSSSPGAAFRLSLPNFEGPLDLLLHLIREHRIDIFDIPIALITEKYLEELERMRSLDLDIAGEFLVMVATLAHIKSRMLLPRQEVAEADVLEEIASPEEQGDPRAELVRRLLEYQKYKAAAEQIARQDLLGRDVFPRRVPVESVPIPEEEVGLVEMSVYKLIEALERVLAAAAPRFRHEVVQDRVKLSDAIRKVADRIRANGNATFFAVFEGARSRSEIIITFLAILEMCRMRLIRVFQETELGDILLSEQGTALDGLAQVEGQEQDDYR